MHLPPCSGQGAVGVIWLAATTMDPRRVLITAVELLVCMISYVKPVIGGGTPSTINAATAASAFCPWSIMVASIVKYNYHLTYLRNTVQISFKYTRKCVIYIITNMLLLPFLSHFSIGLPSYRILISSFAGSLHIFCQRWQDRGIRVRCCKRGE